MDQKERRGPGIYVLVLLLLVLVALTIAGGQSPSGREVPSVQNVTMPLSWPLAAPSQAQVQRARDCDIETLFIERYPPDMGVNDLSGAYAARTGCDWAALAIAYAVRANPGEPPALAGQEALAKATFLNPAYPLTTPALVAYFGLPALVEAPTLAQQPLTGVRLRYSWEGPGDPIAYDVAITAGAEPVASGSVNGLPYEAALPAELVQALGPALGNLVPIGQPLELVVCLDNHPNWSVTLTYADGTQLELATHGSNAISFGGPWQVEIDGQRYMQYAPTFLLALADVVNFLTLPFGQPGTGNCPGLEQSLLDMTYP